MMEKQIVDKQLSQTEIHSLEQLRDHFAEQVKYVDEVLKNKFFPMEAETEIGYIFHDNTEYGGYQNDVVVRSFNNLKELHDRTRD